MLTSRRISPAYRNPQTGLQHYAALTGGVTHSHNQRRPDGFPCQQRPAGIRIRRIRAACLLVVIAAIATVLGDHSLATSSLPVGHLVLDGVPALDGVFAVDGVLALDDHTTRRCSSHRAPSFFAASKRGTGEADGATPRSARRSSTTRFRVSPTLISALPRCPAPSRNRCPVVDGVRVLRRQRLAFALSTRSNSSKQAILEIRLRGGSCPLGGHPHHARSRVRRRGRHGGLVAAAWLSEHGAEYGLCQIYGNEPGTTNCAPKPSIMAARPCTPTLRTIQGCSSDGTRRMSTSSGVVSNHHFSAETGLPTWGRQAEQCTMTFERCERRHRLGRHHAVAGPAGLRFRPGGRSRPGGRASPARSTSP